MYLKRLDIRDFGILYNQSLENLNSGLVVIGGLNRAGKSTTLQLLRNLGYGFPRDNSIPPAKVKYSVQADYEHQGQEYNLSLNGYSEPKINTLNGSLGTNIYAELDSYTYQQLFTISLEELYQLPEKSKEQRKLQSILLGAGLSDILTIQQVKGNLRNKAEDIGGKNGKSNVYKFKEYNRQIKEGIKLREEAKNQLMEYKELQNKLKDIKVQLSKQEELIAKRQAEVTVLDLLKNNYQKWVKKRKLESELDNYDYQENREIYSQSALQQALDFKEDYFAIEKELKQLRSEFRRLTNSLEIKELQKKLTNQQQQLKNINLQISGLKEKINNYKQKKEELKESKIRIHKDLKEENKEWKSFNDLDGIIIDAEAEDQLRQTVEQQQRLEQKYNREKESLANLSQEQQRIKREIAALKDVTINLNLKNYYWWSTGFVVVGIIAFTLDLWVGILLATVGIIGAGINYISNYLLTSNQINQQQNLKSKLKAVKKQVKTKEERLKKLEQEQIPIKNELDSYRQKLNLSAQASGRLIKDRFKAVKDLKREIEKWFNRYSDLKSQEQKLVTELEKIRDLIISFSKQNLLSDLSFEQENLIEVSDQIIESYQELYSYLDLALDISALEKEKKELIPKIESLIQNEIAEESLLVVLNQFINHCERYSEFKELKENLEKLNVQLKSSLNTDRVREALKLYKSSDSIKNLIESFMDLFRNYTSYAELKEVYQRSKEKLMLAKQEGEKLKEKQNTIKKEKNDLSSSDKLRQAQQKINQGRSALKPLAEKFAIKRAAAFILDKVQAKFITKVQDKMLAPASDILAKMTAGDYQQILTQDDLSELDFKLKSKNSVEETIANLSRGTKEQLFLAMRISRIKEIEPNLPVIFDDSLVNFDIFHQQQVINLLVELAQTHQIFVLTCHSQLVNLIREQSSKTQYWKLEQGKFDSITANKLIDYLSLN